MQLEDKYKEYKLNFYRSKNEDFPSKLLRNIIEVSYVSFVVSLKLFAIALTSVLCRKILHMVQRRKRLQMRGLLSLL